MRQSQTPGKMKRNYELEEGPGTPEGRLASVTVPQMETGATDAPGRHPRGRPQTPETGPPSAAQTVRGPAPLPERLRGRAERPGPPGWGKMGSDALSREVPRGPTQGLESRPARCSHGTV